MCTDDNMPQGGDAERGEGTIRRLITDGGFGFIRPARVHGTTRKDLFFHAAQVIGVRYEELREDDLVRYTLADDGRGKGAVAMGVERIRRALDARDEAGHPKEPAPGRWPPAAGRAAAEDSVYDWDQAG